MLDPGRFGPWALITGASAGIGREFGHQVAAHGINVVLSARRGAALESLGRELADRYGVQHRAVPLDLTRDDARQTLASATSDLDLGLVISNAGDAVPGAFLSTPLEEK